MHSYLYIKPKKEGDPKITKEYVQRKSIKLLQNDLQTILSN